MSVTQQEFKDACSSFATGIAVVSIKDEKGVIGLTVNSFLSVTIDPPTILWSLDKESYHSKRFSSNKSFCVTLLAHDQQNLANKFATEMDKNIPNEILDPIYPSLILNRSAGFVCKKIDEKIIKDHILIIGEVEHVDNFPIKSLSYVNRKYS